MNVNTEQYFSEVPHLHAPRSVFDRSFTHKTTMDVNKLYPIFIDEGLPGDSMKLKFQVFGRLLNPLVVPVMDELYFETLWFKSYMLILWDNTRKFFGERNNPSDDNDFVIPTINSGANGFAVGSIFDHFGLPVNVPNLTVNSLPLRMYNMCFNYWLRDQNLVNSVTFVTGDSDSASNYTILKSAKMHDLFTSALPTSQLNGLPFSGSDGVTLPIAGTAPVAIYGVDKPVGFTYQGITDGLINWHYGDSDRYNVSNQNYNKSNFSQAGSHAPADPTKPFYLSSDPNWSGIKGTADLTQVAGISVNDLRFMISLQQFREKLLSNGHRYNEVIHTFFGVENYNEPYLPEFLGMTREMIDINTVIQTSSTDSTSPQGNLTAYGVVNSHESALSTSFRFHGYLLGIARIRHNPVYQQGLNKLWSRSVMLDFYNPMFNGLGEQPILNKEIMCQGGSVLNSAGEPVDDDAFGFNEAWYEYRYYPSLITGQLRSGISQSLDVYHLAQYFGTIDSSTGIGTPALPVLNQSFIEENIPIGRSLSVEPDEENGVPDFVMDFRFEYECARVMPVRNIPAGLYSGI